MRKSMLVPKIRINKAARGAQEDAQHTADHHDGDKMGGIQYRLDSRLYRRKLELIDDQGQDNGDGEGPPAGCTG